MDNKSERVEDLLKMIRQAFAGVVLGDGVSLRQTKVLDLYGSEEELRAAWELDEKDDWQKLIDDPELADTSCFGGLCFLDKAGLLFHLPAYLSLAVKHPFEDVVSCLIFRCYPEYCHYFEMLSETQRTCVYAVLSFLQEVLEDENADARLKEAIDLYWQPDISVAQRQQYAMNQIKHQPHIIITTEHFVETMKS